MSNAPRRLITIPFSHYCEKARWALDRGRIEYAEEPHVPTLHYLASFWAAGSPFVPVLIEDGEPLIDSTEIVRRADRHYPAEARLFPEGELGALVERLEDDFDERLGPTGRLWAYFNWFEDMPRLIHHATMGVPNWEKIATPMLAGIAKRWMIYRLGISKEASDRAIETVREVFGEVGRMLSDGRRYLTGPQFTAADIAFASLAAPLLLPSQYGSPLPEVDQAPPVMREEIKRLRDTPAGQFALRLYVEDRRPARALEAQNKS